MLLFVYTPIDHVPALSESKFIAFFDTSDHRQLVAEGEIAEKGCQHEHDHTNRNKIFFVIYCSR